jgi:hypothetical protein
MLLRQFCNRSTPCISFHSGRYSNIEPSNAIFICCWQAEIYLVGVILDIRIFTADNTSVETGTSGQSCSAWKQRRFGCEIVRILLLCCFFCRRCWVSSLKVSSCNVHPVLQTYSYANVFLEFWNLLSALVLLQKEEYFKGFNLKRQSNEKNMQLDFLAEM